MSSLIHLLNRGCRMTIKFGSLNRSSLLKNLRPNAVAQRPTYATSCLNRPINNHAKLLKFKHQLNSNELANRMQIRTTNPNRLPPVFWLIARPVLNMVAALGGRRARRWWRALPEERKQHYRNKLRTNKRVLYGLLSGLAVLSGVYYYSHLEEAPITKRKRFVAFSKDRYNELNEIQFEMHLKLFQSKLLPSNHPYSRMVERVARRIIHSNLDIKEFKEKHWTTAVIDAPNVKNAMVVGDGKIFVFTGMLNLCENDDSLGFVLSHEIAHSILSHGIEILSQSKFLDAFIFVAAFCIWSIFPTDLSALLGHILTTKLIDILFNLPFTRDLETEADKVAMLFAAKSCFDVREGVAFWQAMSHEKNKFEQMTGEAELENIEFLSTHPTHEKRAEYLESMLRETIELREQCNCPRLPRSDPIERVKRKIEAEKSKKQALFSVIKVP